jgi:hypothetical protein
MYTNNNQVCEKKLLNPKCNLTPYCHAQSHYNYKQFTPNFNH